MAKCDCENRLTKFFQSPTSAEIKKTGKGNEAVINGIERLLLRAKWKKKFLMELGQHYHHYYHSYQPTNKPVDGFE